MLDSPQFKVAHYRGPDSERVNTTKALSLQKWDRDGCSRPETASGLMQTYAALARVRRPWICTSAGLEDFLDGKFVEAMPILANDFSQSCTEGPRIFPSMYASPGQRVQLVR
jgi:hypothetical protein